MLYLNSVHLLNFLLIYLILINICHLNAKQHYPANETLPITALPLTARFLNNNSHEVVVAAASISLGYNVKNKKNIKLSNNLNFNTNLNLNNNNNKNKDNIVIGFLAEYSQMRVSL